MTNFEVYQTYENAWRVFSTKFVGKWPFCTSDGTEIPVKHRYQEFGKWLFERHVPIYKEAYETFVVAQRIHTFLDDMGKSAHNGDIERLKQAIDSLVNKAEQSNDSELKSISAEMKSLYSSIEGRITEINPYKTNFGRICEKLEKKYKEMLALEEKEVQGC